jgi:hypothetical protein
LAPVADFGDRLDGDSSPLLPLLPRLKEGSGKDINDDDDQNFDDDDLKKIMMKMTMMMTIIIKIMMMMKTMTMTRMKRIDVETSRYDIPVG